LETAVIENDVLGEICVANFRTCGVFLELLENLNAPSVQEFLPQHLITKFRPSDVHTEKMLRKPLFKIATIVCMLF
jgi:hypothetical protein